MAHVQKHSRYPCQRCKHPLKKHENSTKGACIRPDCDCPRWKDHPRNKVSWQARWLEPDKTERCKVFERKIDADQFLVAMEDSKFRGSYISPELGKTPFREQAERWFATTATLRASTTRDYRLLLDWQVLPWFGDKPLNSIDAFTVREWMAALAAGKARGPEGEERPAIGAKRIRKAHGVLKLVLDSAVQGGRLAVNRAVDVRLPKQQAHEMEVLDVEQLERLADAIAKPFGTLVRFDGYMGLRPGELTALRVRHVDLLRGVCNLVDAAPEVGGKLDWGPLKSYERRTMRLPKFLVKELEAYLDAYPRGADDLLFTARLGGPIRPSKWIPVYFKKALLAAKLPERTRLYDLRHTAASLAIHEGASVLAVQKLLGHKDAVITLKTYAHLWPSELEALAERLDDARERSVSERIRTPDGPNVPDIRERAGQ